MSEINIQKQNLVYNKKYENVIRIFGIIAIMWIAWYFSGGVYRFEQENPGKFIKPLELDKEAETYN